MPDRDSCERVSAENENDGERNGLFFSPERGEMVIFARSEYGAIGNRLPMERKGI